MIYMLVPPGSAIQQGGETQGRGQERRDSTLLSPRQHPSSDLGNAAMLLDPVDAPSMDILDGSVSIDPIIPDPAPDLPLETELEDNIEVDTGEEEAAAREEHAFAEYSKQLPIVTEGQLPLAQVLHRTTAQAFLDLATLVEV